MGKKISYEEKFKRFKEELKEESMRKFLSLYLQFKEIEEGLIKEKREQWHKKA